MSTARYNRGYVVYDDTVKIEPNQIWIGRNHERVVVTAVDDNSVRFTLNGEGPFTLTQAMFRNCATLYIPDEKRIA